MEDHYLYAMCSKVDWTVWKPSPLPPEIYIFLILALRKKYMYFIQS